MPYNSEERIGVYSVAKIFAEELQWIFREQPTNDFGIDGFVEITSVSLNLKERIPTGKLFSVQIKSGRSFFRETKDDYFIFRGSNRHLEYWLNHSIPVVLIIYDKDSNSAYWQEVNESTIILTEKSFKVQIPKTNVLNNKSKEELAGIAYFKNRYEYKLWQLQTSRDQIELLINRQMFLYLEIDSHSNFNNNYYITSVITDENSDNYPELIYRHHDQNPNRFEYSLNLIGGKSLVEALKDTLPWADFLLNNTAFTDELLKELIAIEVSDYDKQEFIQDVFGLNEEKDILSLVCYSTGSCCLRLELKANELTHAFLTIDSFLNKEPITKQRVFL